MIFSLLSCSCHNPVFVQDAGSSFQLEVLQFEPMSFTNQKPVATCVLSRVFTDHERRLPRSTAHCVRKVVLAAVGSLAAGYSSWALDVIFIPVTSLHPRVQVLRCGAIIIISSSRTHSARGSKPAAQRRNLPNQAHPHA